MNKKETLIRWIFKWVLTSLFGMCWASKRWFESYKGSLSGITGENGGSIISVSGRDGSITEIQTTGSVSSYDVSPAPGTSVNITDRSGGNLTPQQLFSLILFFLSLYMAVGVYFYISRPGMSPRSSTLSAFDKINQGIFIVLLIAYVLNLTLLFVDKYIANKEAGMHTALNLIFIGIFLGLTLAYVFWGMVQMGETRLKLFFPVKYFSGF